MDRPEADTITPAEHLAFTAISSYRNSGTYAQGHLRVSIQNKTVCVCVCVCARVSERWREIHAHIAKQQEGRAGRLEEGSREREGEINLEKGPHFEAQLGYISFLDLAHIGQLLELNSELYSNMEEKEVVRRG